MHAIHVTRIFLVLSCLSLCLIRPASHAQEDSDAGIEKRIAELIKGLDADKFKERERAEQDLRRIGKKAKPALEAALENDSPEVRIRAKGILKDVGRSIYIVENVEHPDINHICAVSISPDSKFLYTAGWRANAVAVFAVDAKTGKLKHQQTVKDADHVGAVCVRLSDDGTMAAATCFNSKTVVLYRRDAKTGQLEKLDVFRGSMKSGPLAWPAECAFSPDGKHLLVLDAFRVDPASGKKTGSLMVLKIKDDKLECVQAQFGEDGGKHGNDMCFANGRSIDFHPAGTSLYIAASHAGCVIAMDWDAKAGKATIKQIVQDEKNGVTGLDGVMGLTCSRDGNFVYTSSGRFRGDSSVGVFSIDKKGQLARVQELIAGKDKLDDFLGGNELTLSPDGTNLYVTGTLSATLAGFERDAKTGKLSFIETVPLGQGKELGPAGIAINKDGTFVYVAVESVGKVAIFKRPKE